MQKYLGWAIAIVALPLVAQDPPYVDRVEPFKVRAGQKLAVIGKHFGADDPNGIGGVVLTECPRGQGTPGAALSLTLSRSELLSWSDTRIEFTFPPRVYGTLFVKAMSGRATGIVDFQVENLCAAPTENNKPVIAQVLSSASLRPAPLSPGAVTTLIGWSLAPEGAGSTTLGQEIKQLPFELAGVRVSAGSIAAPMLSAEPDRVTFIAPFALSGTTETEIRVSSQGRESDPYVAAVAKSAPAVFALPASAGPAGLYNEDGRENSTVHPAGPGETVGLFATGLGLLAPPVSDGTVPPETAHRLVIPPEVLAAGAICEVLEAGPAPGMPAGIMRVIFRLPSSVRTNPATPIVLLSGGSASQADVTLAVQSKAPGGAN